MNIYISKYTSILICFIFFNFASITLAQKLPLVDLSAFEKPTDHWQIVGYVSVNPLVKESFETGRGKGILVGTALPAGENSTLETNMQHRDIAVEFDMLLSHDASAVVWLQGRYGLRLADSWKFDRLRLSDNGAIIPPQLNGAEALGYLPSMNAVRAPGTWQHLKLVFEAAQFNSDGVKIQRARLKSVEQNGIVIQENQYLPSVSKGALFSNESSKGPLVFQVSNGNIALRNIEITKYGDKKVKFEDLSYQLYLEKFLDNEFVYWGGAPGDQIPIPDFSSRKADQEGDISQIHTNMSRGKGNDFALVFKGTLLIPKSGHYNFEAVQNGVGAFSIMDEELLRWDVLHHKGNTNTTVELSQGKYDFTFINVNFASASDGNQSSMGLYVEGPGIKRHPLHRGGQFPQGNSTEPILLNPENGPLIQRSFLKYSDDEKLLSTVSVGYPDGVHYSFDMATGALVLAWRGPFADATPMWHGRGAQHGRHQILEPTGSVLALTADRQVWLEGNESHNIQRRGYTLNNHREPVFEYAIGSIKVTDQIFTERSSPTLKRILRFTNTNGESPQAVLYRVASADTIQKIADNMYSIDGHTYFIQLDTDVEATITQEGDQQQLIIPLQIGNASRRLTYSVIW